MASVAIEDFDALWRHVLNGQCESLRMSGQRWSYDPLRNKLAVIVEPRTHHPFFEATIRNMMHSLDGQGWNLAVFTTDVARASAMFPGCDMIVTQLPVDNLNEQEYSALFMSEGFWKSLEAEHLLIFQTDVVMLRPLKTEFLAFDYAGANVYLHKYVSPRVGAMNGGFSLRKRSAMLECIRRVPVQRVCAALGAQSNAYIPEDIYFTHACEMIGLSMPPVDDRKHLAIEEEYYHYPCAFHGFQHTYYYYSYENCRQLITHSPFLSQFAPELGGTSFAFSPTDYAVVVAPFKKDTSWIPGHAPSNVIVYNKGGSHPPLPTGYTVVDLVNVGRESHTYLTYILQHYDRLPEVVHFTTAGLDDKLDSVDFVDIEAYSRNTTRAKFCHGLTSDGHISYYLGEYTGPSNEAGPAWFARCVDPIVDLKDDIDIWYGSIFSVRRENILSRPRSYYEGLLQQLQCHTNPEIGHFMERSWFYIFQCHIGT